MKLTIVAMLIALLFASCASVAPPETSEVPEKALTYQIDEPLYNQADSKLTMLKMSLWDQKAWLLDGQQRVLLVTDISTGVDGRETPAGSYKILEKLKEKRSNKYGRYVNKESREVVVEKSWEHQGPVPKGCEYEGIMMPYWLRLTWYGIGVHVGQFKRRVRSSFGCIRVYEEAQPYIFEKVVVGTPVVIVEESLIEEMHGAATLR